MSDKMLNSAIYKGSIKHTRFRDRQHRFSYQVFMMYLDLDELETVFKKNIFWSCQYPALARFRQRDYFLRDDCSTVKQSVQKFVSEQSGETFTGKVCLLSNLRYFGFIINPISCYYCFDESQTLKYLVAEVTNTPWKEVHRYLLDVPEDKQSFQMEFNKALHVSPFMPMDMCYQWRGNQPEQKLWINLKSYENVQQKKQLAFDASLVLKRKEITPWSLSFILIQFPLMTVKVAIGIYWQALKLFLKGAPLFKHFKFRNQGVHP